MAKVSITQLATLVRLEPEVLLEKLKQAGVEVSSIDQQISDDEKRQLLVFLQKNRAVPSSTTAPTSSKITLQRKSPGVVKQGKKSVNVEFRKKRTFTRPVDIQEPEAPKPEQPPVVADAVDSKGTTETDEVVEINENTAVEQQVDQPEKNKSSAEAKDSKTIADTPASPERTDLKRRRKKKGSHERHDKDDFDNDESVLLSPLKTHKRKKKSSKPASIEQSFAMPVAPAVHEVMIPESMPIITLITSAALIDIF